MKRIVELLSIVVLALTVITSVQAESYIRGTTLTGTVVGVSDGDTLTVLVNGAQNIRVRLAEIDAPEKSQAFGQVSKQSLSDLVYRKQVSVVVMSTDRYGRTVGRVYAGATDVNLTQVSKGLAWAYTQYLTDQNIAKAEQLARNQGLGLWIDKDPTPPWLFRRGKESKAARVGELSRNARDMQAQMSTILKGALGQ